MSPRDDQDGVHRFIAMVLAASLHLVFSLFRAPIAETIPGNESSVISRNLRYFAGCERERWFYCLSGMGPDAVFGGQARLAVEVGVLSEAVLHRKFCATTAEMASLLQCIVIAILSGIRASATV